MWRPLVYWCAVMCMSVHVRGGMYVSVCVCRGLEVCMGVYYMYICVYMKNERI